MCEENIQACKDVSYYKNQMDKIQQVLQRGLKLLCCKLHCCACITHVPLFVFNCVNLEMMPLPGTSGNQG